MPGEDAPVLFNRYGSILDGLSGVDYSCAGLEISDVQRALRLSGQPFRYHVQAVIFFKNARTFSAVKSIFPGAHLEKVNGPPLVASNYCKKGEQSHQEWENDGPLGVNYGYNSMIDERGVLPLSRAEVSAKGNDPLSTRIKIPIKSRNMATPEFLDRTKFNAQKVAEKGVKSVTKLVKNKFYSQSRVNRGLEF